MCESNYDHPLMELPFFGYKKGERIRMMKGGGWISKEPDWIEVVEELPNFLIVRFVYKHWDGRLTGYNRCLNKVDIAIGNVGLC